MLLIDVVDEYITVLDEEMGSNLDYKMNENDAVTNEIREYYKNRTQVLITILSVIGEHRILDCRIDK